MDLSILWTVGPEVIPGFDRPNKYALCFIGGIILGYYIVKRIYAKEKVDVKEIDNLLMWVIVSTIVGARLGHVFFYEWHYYQDNIGEIIKVWKGGLASHGAAIGIILGIVLFRKFSSKMPVLWTLDRAIIGIAIAACFIRVGNLMNSEIKGKSGDGAMSFIFAKNYEKKMYQYFGDDIDVQWEATGEDSTYNNVVHPEYKITVKLPAANNKAITSFIINESNEGYNGTFETLAMNKSKLTEEEIHESEFTIYMYMIPRVPTQLIEAFGYLIIFLILLALYWKTNAGKLTGFLFGAFLIGNFGFRFFVEYLKEGQAMRDSETLINTGQMLSIPFVIVGLYFVFRNIKEFKKGYSIDVKEEN
jgi:prolipoprotein diacylglyceryltransferase